MGSLYRSEPMTLCQMYLQTEAAYDCISELGEVGLVQFKDLNVSVNAFQRKFVNEVRRCEEMERKLRFLEKELKRDNIVAVDNGENPPAPLPREMSDLENNFEQLEKEVRGINSNTDVLLKNFLDLTELKHLLRKTHSFFEEYDRHIDDQLIDPSADESESSTLIIDDRPLHASHSVRLGFVAGVINRDRLAPFERMLFRVCHGNAFLKYADIESPLEDFATGDDIYKSVFLIFHQGEQLKSRVLKICEGFHANMYPCPETQAERREMSMGVMSRIEDLNIVLKQTHDHRYRVLMTAAENMRVWTIKVRKIKAIYHTLNWFSFDITQKCLIGECWCPMSQLEKIQLALHRGTHVSGSSDSAAILNRMATKEQPPTYNRTNKFTSVFQNIVDAYGVASYMEINPAPFTIITFPFLFSVMFGDAGHGLILLIVGLVMILKERKLMQSRSDNELWTMLFGGRYIIFLMGIFSIYAGFMYNDFFAKPLNIFGSAWSAEKYDNSTLKSSKKLQLNPHNASADGDFNGYPYAFGMDPVWQIAENKITWLNSFKMKISVVFGISQMLFGVLLSLQNHRFFHNSLNIICQFVPEIIFLSATFGYLIILIFHKWIAYDADQSGTAPSLLIGFINMFLFNYDPEIPEGEPGYVSGHQKGVQIFLIIVAMLCIPWILIPKPIILKRQHERRQRRSSGTIFWQRGEETRLLGASEDHELLQLTESSLSVQSGDIVLREEDGAEVRHHAPHENGLHHEEAEEEFDFGDIFVHQCIHTIEYCLGCVSHTASYLRLWALSLAHAQLSEVLWKMILHNGLTVGNEYARWILIFLVFAPWAVLTLVILLVMEGLSAFLHTLRLHWVEFQSKFYKGEGYLFEPFSFSKIEYSVTTEEEIV